MTELGFFISMLQNIKKTTLQVILDSGGAQEIRTPHLFHAMEALYQMS